MAAARMREKKLWQAFWVLSGWFLEPARPGTLKTNMKTAVATSESRASRDARQARREGRPEPFAAYVLPRLREIDAIKGRLELGHQTSDAVEVFLGTAEDLFNGPLPPCYRGGNFTLKYCLGQIVIETNNWSAEQLDDAFPTAPSVAPSFVLDFDCQDVKRWLRECFQIRLQARVAQLRKEMMQQYRREFPIPDGSLDHAACRQELQRMRKRGKHQVHVIQRDAEKEALRLQEEIQRLDRAQSRAHRHARASDDTGQQRKNSLTAEIDARLLQLADIEQQATAEYEKYHAVLLKARSHLQAEAGVIRQLKRKCSVPGGAEDGFELGLETGASLNVICEQLERDWEAIASV
jgi:hypothetical protein